MKAIIIELRKKSKWPIVGNGFIAWLENDRILITIKINKIGLFIVRGNGTIMATSMNEDVIIEWIDERIWEKLGIH